MLFEITYAICWFLMIFFALRYVKIFRTEGLKKWDLPLAFLIKSLAGVFFIYIYTYYYGVGFLVFDSKIYISDAKILNDVCFDSPINYLKFLTGIGESDELVLHYLKSTEKWSSSEAFISNDAKNLVRINSVIHFFSFNNIYVHFLIFNLICIQGIRYIYLFFKEMVWTKSRFFFFALILLPSLLFWGSGVLKEPILLFGIGLFLHAISNYEQQGWKKWLYISLSLFILVNVKAYIILSFIVPFLFCFLAFKVLKAYRLRYTYLTLVLVMFSGVFIFYKQTGQLVAFISNKQFDFNNVGKGGVYFIEDNSPYVYCIQGAEKDKMAYDGTMMTVKEPLKASYFNRKRKDELKEITLYPKAGKVYEFRFNFKQSDSYIKPELIGNSGIQLIKNIPQALGNAIFRPLIQDPGKKFKYFAFTETCLLFGFLLFALIRRRKVLRNELILISSLVQFFITLALIIGWTTPILGALVRYRVPIYLSLLIIGFMILNPPPSWKKKENTF